jgi:hypothetical protein
MGHIKGGSHYQVAVSIALTMEPALGAEKLQAIKFSGTPTSGMRV